MLHHVRGLAQRMADKRGKQADKAFKRWNDKAERNAGFEDRAGIFSATKLIIETTSSKLLGLEVDQTAKPNQTSLVLCLRFLSLWHYQGMFTKGRFYTENV